ncbi:uncharacterized protein LOC142976013 [Anticarsia gemmatalis]|uniref:uncharacterized protein LOC142976013 n=1 Tax=Anticarsia gemmatalis TaxID=129554 RepID=UPI003F760C9F
MKRLFILAAVSALAVAKPELYKEQEDFQYSRSSSDDGTRSGFYGAQRGNMGGNYERAHNMDSLAQNQMSGLVKQVEGELGDGANTRTGSVYSAANSRGTFGSGHFDLSNLAGRNFQEGTSYSGNSQSRLSSLSQQSSAHNTAGFTKVHSQSYGDQRYQGYQGAATNTQSQTNSGYRYGGYRASTTAQTQADNLQSLDNSQASSYDYGRQTGYNSGYQSQSGLQQSEYGQSNTNSQDSLGYGSNVRTRLITTTPVKVILTPGGRVAIPVAAQTYDATHGASVIDRNAINTETEVVGDNAHGIVYRPSNAKTYQSSYSYHKKWEKHDTIPTTITDETITEASIPKNSELYDDRQTKTSGSQYGVRGVDAQSTHSGSATGRYSTVNSGSSQSRYQTAYNTQQRGTAVNSNSNLYTQTYPVSVDSYNRGVSSDSLNAYTQSQYNAGTRYHGSSSSDSNSNAYTQSGYTGSQSDLNSQVENLNTRPKSYQSSYSYHKSWERQGDPYVIKPATTVYYDGQSSQRLTSATKNQGYAAYQSGSHYHQNQADCDENGHIRVARSYNEQKDNDDHSQNLEDFGQQSQNLQDFSQQSQNLQDFGQQSQTLHDFGQESQNPEDFGQQSQTLHDFGQESQNLEDFGQQSQNLHDFGQQSQNLEDFGQQTQHTGDFGQQTQQNWYQNNEGQQSQKLEDFGQQNLADFGQQTQQTQQLEDVGQQSQNLDDFGQHSQKVEDFGQQPQRLEDFSQQSQNTGDLSQQSQINWAQHFGTESQKLEDLGQQSQTTADLDQQSQDVKDFDQQSQNIGDYGQQSQTTWDQQNVGQQSQKHWQKLDDLFGQREQAQNVLQQHIQEIHHQITSNQHNEQQTEHKIKEDHEDKNSEPVIDATISSNIENPWDKFDIVDANKYHMKTVKPPKEKDSKTESYDFYWHQLPANGGMDQRISNVITERIPYQEQQQPFDQYVYSDSKPYWQQFRDRIRDNIRFYNNKNVSSTYPNLHFSYSDGFVNPSVFDKRSETQELTQSWQTHVHTNSQSQVNWQEHDTNADSFSQVNHFQSNVQSPLSGFWNQLSKIEKVSGLSTNGTRNVSDVYTGSQYPVGEHTHQNKNESTLHGSTQNEFEQQLQSQVHKKIESNTTISNDKRTNTNSANQTHTSFPYYREMVNNTGVPAYELPSEIEGLERPQDQGRGDIGSEDLSSDIEPPNKPRKPVRETGQNHMPVEVEEPENDLSVLSLDQQNIQKTTYLNVSEQNNAHKSTTQKDKKLMIDYSHNSNQNKTTIHDQHNVFLVNEQNHSREYFRPANTNQKEHEIGQVNKNINQQVSHDFEQQNENQQSLQDFGQQNDNQQNLQDFGQQNENLNQQNLQDFGQQNEKRNQQSLQDFGQQNENLNQQNLQDFGQQNENLNQQNLQDFGQQNEKRNQQSLQDFGQQNENLNQQNIQDFGQHNENLNQQNLQDFSQQNDKLYQQTLQEFGQQSVNQNQQSLQDFGQQSENLNQQSLQDFGQQNENLNQQSLQEFGQQSENLNQQSLQDFVQQNFQDFGQQSENFNQHSLQNFAEQNKSHNQQNAQESQNKTQNSFQSSSLPNSKNNDSQTQRNLQNQKIDVSNQDIVWDENTQFFGQPNANLDQQNVQSFDQINAPDFGQYNEQVKIQRVISSEHEYVPDFRIPNEQLEQRNSQDFGFRSQKENLQQAREAGASYMQPHPRSENIDGSTQTQNQQNNTQTSTAVTKKHEPVTEKPGFWKSIGNKLSSAKKKVASWFGN